MTANFWCFILLTSISFNIHSQAINFTVEDGLPSNTVYHIYQSPSGYVWFTTDNGISRYDGKQFTNYTDQDGLPDIEIFELFEDTKKRAWMFTHNGHIGYMINDRYPEFIVIDTLSFQDRITHISEGSDGSIWMSSADGGIVSISNQLKVMKLPIENKKVFSFILNEDGTITYFTPNIFKYENGKSTLLLNHRGKTSSSIRVEVFENYAFINGIGNRGFYKFNLETLDSDYIKSEQPVLNFYEYMGEFTVFTSTSFYSLNSESSHPQTSPTFRIRDIDGFYWTSTLKNGVWLTKQKAESAVDQVKLNGEAVLYTTINDNQLKVAYNSRKIDSTLFTLPTFMKPTDDISSLIDRNYFTDFGQAPKSFRTKGNYGINRELTSFWTYYIDDIQAGKSSLASRGFEKPHGWIKDDSNNLWEFSSQSIYINSKFLDCALQAYAKMKSKVLLAESQQLLIINTSQEFDNESIDTLEIQGVRRILPINDKTCWIAGRNGLKKLNVETYTTESSRHFIDEDIVEMVKGVGGFVLNIRDKGIWIMDESGIANFSKAEGLFENNITHLVADQDEVWISTPTGLNKITKTADGFKVSAISSSSHFSSSHFNDMEIFNDQLHLATDTGLVIMKKGFELISKQHLIKDLLSVSIDDQIIDHNNAITLPFNHFQIEFTYDVVAPANFDELWYAFKLQRNDGQKGAKWITSKEPYQQFSNLQPGDYTLYAKSRSTIGDWLLTDPIYFSVKKPYWQNPFFYILAMMLIGSIVGLLYRRTQRNRERMHLLNVEISDSKLKALRSQINPHFIFNSLNSIRKFMLQKDFENADKYLTEMSALLRELFEGSDQMVISLRRELDNLRLYLSLEQLRFNDRFTYRFILDEKLDPDSMKIPSMIIQPILENAIWHGFGNASSKGSIEVTFSLTDEFLKIDICDNGQGFNFNLDLNKLSGLKIVKDRIELLNEIHRTNGGLTIESEEGKGTNVSIRIPSEIVTDD